MARTRLTAILAATVITVGVGALPAVALEAPLPVETESVLPTSTPTEVTSVTDLLPTESPSDQPTEDDPTTSPTDALSETVGDVAETATDTVGGVVGGGDGTDDGDGSGDGGLVTGPERENGTRASGSSVAPAPDPSVRSSSSTPHSDGARRPTIDRAAMTRIAGSSGSMRAGTATAAVAAPEVAAPEVAAAEVAAPEVADASPTEAVALSAAVPGGEHVPGALRVLATAIVLAAGLAWRKGYLAVSA